MDWQERLLKRAISCCWNSMNARWMTEEGVEEQVWCCWLSSSNGVVHEVVEVLQYLCEKCIAAEDTLGRWKEIESREVTVSTCFRSTVQARPPAHLTTNQRALRQACMESLYHKLSRLRFWPRRHVLKLPDSRRCCMCVAEAWAAEQAVLGFARFRQYR